MNQYFLASLAGDQANTARATFGVFFVRSYCMSITAPTFLAATLDVQIRRTTIIITTFKHSKLQELSGVQNCRNIAYTYHIVANLHEPVFARLAKVPYLSFFLCLSLSLSLLSLFVCLSLPLCLHAHRRAWAQNCRHSTMPQDGIMLFKSFATPVIPTSNYFG